MPITIKNTSGRMRPFNLEHAGLRDLGPPYGYRLHTGGQAHHDASTGARQPYATRKFLPAVLTLQAGEVRADVPRMVKDCPEVAAALKSGALKIIKETADGPAPSPPAPATPVRAKAARRTTAV